LREVRVEMCDTVDKYLSERMEQRVQIKLIKSCLFAKIGCCLPRDCDAKTPRRAADVAADVPVIMSLAAVHSHTCEFLIRVHPRDME